MSEANRQLALRWFEEVWNRKQESAIDAMFHADGKCYGFPDLKTPIGIEGFKQMHRSFCGAFPDIHVEVEDVIAEGQHIAVRWTATMTHQGDHLGFPASGRSASLAGSTFLIAEEGRFASGWNYMDMAGLFQSLQQ